MVNLPSFLSHIIFGFQITPNKLISTNITTVTDIIVIHIAVPAVILLKIRFRKRSDSIVNDTGPVISDTEMFESSSPSVITSEDTLILKINCATAKRVNNNNNEAEHNNIHTIITELILYYKLKQNTILKK